MEGRGTPIDLSKKVEEVETGASNSGLREPTMATSDHRNNSNNNGLEEEKKKDSISTVSLGCKLYGFWVKRKLGFAKMALNSLNMDDNFGLYMVVCIVMKSVSEKYGWFGISLEGG